MPLHYCTADLLHYESFSAMMLAHFPECSMYDSSIAAAA